MNENEKKKQILRDCFAEVFKNPDENPEKRQVSGKELALVIYFFIIGFRMGRAKTDKERDALMKEYTQVLTGEP